MPSRRLTEENATDARAKVRSPADRERVDVEWCLLEPSGVVGDESEHTKTDLTALDQSSARNHDEGDRTNCNFSKKVAKTPAPWWAPTVMVLSLTVEWGVSMERQGPSYGVVVHTGV